MRLVLIVAIAVHPIREVLKPVLCEIVSPLMLSSFCWFWL